MVDLRRGEGVSALVYLHSSVCEDLWSTGGGLGSVCTGICAYFYMGILVGVVFFQRSMVNWRRGGVYLHWCSGLP